MAQFICPLRQIRKLFIKLHMNVRYNLFSRPLGLPVMWLLIRTIFIAVPLVGKGVWGKWLNLIEIDGMGNLII